MEEEILKIIGNNPLRLRESFFVNNYPEIHEIIVNYTINLNLPFKQRIWHFLNKEKDYIACKACGNRVTFNKNWLQGYKLYCSSKCTQSNEETKKKREKTLLEKYGVDNIAKLDETKKKQEETNYRLYGTKSTFQNEKVREKWRNSIKDKWGVDHYFKTDEFKLQAQLTSLEKWGVKHFVQSSEYKDKLNEIGFADKIRENNYYRHIEKYKSYGFKFISITDRFLRLYSYDCDHEFDIHYDVFMNRISSDHKVCTICNNTCSGQSNKEKDLIKWVDSLNIDYMERHRKLGVELDVYLPNYKLAIEFNGLYWHSDIHKDKKYHLNKSVICQKNDITLLHIWEDDWDYKCDIIKSIILNKLNIIENKIWARKCQIKNVSSDEKNIFLINNHIQGNTRSKYNIGLYYNDKLVSLMCFNYVNNNPNKGIELIRFCSLLNTTVVGGASKLFKHFIKISGYKKVISFSDMSMFNGSLYTQLGFKYESNTPPNFWWVVKGKRFHRFTYNKKKLIKLGGDPSKTEAQIMNDMNNYRIWGCGLKKWIYSEF
jgi:hypothetical protein